jgi:hypothetical protein
MDLPLLYVTTDQAICRDGRRRLRERRVPSGRRRSAFSRLFTGGQVDLTTRE